ncbi:MAG TPA: ATPase, T2SS/T4P/T4SS family, partial [Oceanipulchritudo sp.]|nr:ATPase, T2SS/T4P/T4SS family [Oceanipulchritudo sp.]
MTPYRPFLLPLLPEGEVLPRVTSPLEEEHLIEERMARVPTIWSSLAEQLRETCGIDLILDLEDRARPDDTMEGLKEKPLSRYLELRLGRSGKSIFLIEHPEGIRQFDRSGKPDQVLAVARPSLFARLLHGLEASSMPDPPPPGPSDEDSVPALSTFLESLLFRHPSDWHLEPEETTYRSRIRVHGFLSSPETLSRARGDWLIDSLIARCGIANQASGTPLEGRSTQGLRNGQKVTLRASFTPARYGYSLALRFLYETPAEAHSFTELGLDPGQTRRLLGKYAQREGLWLLVGPTGSGKTTTLHSLLSRSVSAGEKVLAIEDPVERVLPGVHHLN